MWGLIIALYTVNNLVPMSTFLKPSLFNLIGELRENYDSCKRLNKQRIISIGVDTYSKLLTSRDCVSVCEILLDIYDESYSLDENISDAIYDYLNPWINGF
jgi:hypothetical protein